MIVIGAVAIAGVVGYGVYVKFIRKPTAYRQSETEKSLLEREGEFEGRESSSGEEESGSEEEESGSEEGDEEEADVQPADE